MLLDDSIRKNLTIILVGDEAAEQLGDSEARSFSDHSTQTARTFWRDILIHRIPFLLALFVHVVSSFSQEV